MANSFFSCFKHKPPYIYLYLYAFSRRFYPQCILGYTCFFVSMFVPWECYICLLNVMFIIKKAFRKINFNTIQHKFSENRSNYPTILPQKYIIYRAVTLWDFFLPRWRSNKYRGLVVNRTPPPPPPQSLMTFDQERMQLVNEYGN